MTDDLVQKSLNTPVPILEGNFSATKASSVNDGGVFGVLSFN